MPARPFRDKTPCLGERVWLAPTAFVTGDVTLGDDVSFWFNTAARGDVNWIKVGAGTNVQDGAVLHVSYKTHSLEIGERVVIGHSAVVHGCVIEDGALIGIGAKVLDGAVIERGAQIAAGAVVSPRTRIPAGHLAMGVPARVIRPLNEREAAYLADGAQRYIELKEEYAEMFGRGD